MDVNRLRTGEKIAGVAAVLLFIDLFLNWYSFNISGALGAAVRSFGVDTSVSAWQAFAWVDLVLAIACLAAIAMVVLRGTGRSVSLPVSLPLVVAALGAFGTLIVLYRIINQPGPNDAVNVEYGAYIGLVLVAALTYGAIQAGGGVDELRAEAEALAPDVTPAPAAGGSVPPPTGGTSTAEPAVPPQASVPTPPPPAPEPPAAVEPPPAPPEPPPAPPEPPPAPPVPPPAPEPPAPEPEPDPAPEPPAPEPDPEPDPPRPPDPPAAAEAPPAPAQAETRVFESPPEPVAEPPGPEPSPDPGPEPDPDPEPAPGPTFVGDDDEPPASEPPPPRTF